MKSDGEPLSKYALLDIIMTIIMIILVWSLSCLIIFDVLGDYSIIEKIFHLLILAPSVVIWTYLGIHDFERYWKRRNRINNLEVGV